MFKTSFLFLFTLTVSCQTGNLKVIADLPFTLKEVSGVQTSSNGNLLWMLNDGGNKPRLYGVNENGNIMKDATILAKNRDWEDLTSDSNGNIYIGDFGNNDNDSKNLAILIVSENDLLNKTEVSPKKIKFSYPEQNKFPPKNNKRHFDCEAFFHFQDSLYLFTKSRYSKKPGKTNLYVLPAKPGTYKAKQIDSFNTCNKKGCWVTSADINTSKDKVALLTENQLIILSNFTDNQFFKGTVNYYPFDYKSQKESVCFKNDSTVYITDEFRGIDGGNLYEFKIAIP
ncbi:hypothetical protein [Seonamhaeicola aphaedonensis]|uniref:SdiA-regulated protein n=1 Tax=Seonamhaeicola aphaedonensis TaxID=1461338 RepID=A0A3D9H8E1_9FLAO|nr:hypothetical protein [Seonamhaeicola aphaedonensis]RED45745.1 hypothetical protein DFQ02_108124 [Seonamhaeicola aphaedonensis]